MSGWIKLHRKMLDWEWYDDINVMRLFTHCLLRANHKEKKWRGIDIKRGQFYTSLETLSSETGLTAMQLRTCFDKLKTTGEITSSGMARGRMITVVQYDEYQDDNKQSDRVATGLQQAGNRVATTNKNDKNEKNEKNEKNTLVQAEPKRSKFSFSDNQMRFAKAVYEKVKVITPKMKEPNLESWANTARLLNEVDGADLNDVWKVFQWANADNFWSVNILSLAKLRDKYPDLSAKMKAGLVAGVLDYPDMTNGFVVKRAVFSGKAFARVKINSDV